MIINKKFYSAAEVNPGDPEPKIDPIPDPPKVDANVLAAQQAAQIAQQAAWMAQQSKQEQPKKSYEDPNWLKDQSLFKRGLGEMISEHTAPLIKRNQELNDALTQMYATSAQDPNAERTKTKATELSQKYGIPHGTAMIMAREQFNQSVPSQKPPPPKSATSSDSKQTGSKDDGSTERFSDYDVPIVKGDGKDFKSIIKDLRKSGKF